jgi:hypothetical protein
MLQLSSIVLIVCVLANTPVQGISRRLVYRQGSTSLLTLKDDPGEPLFLTPYLEQGKVDEARRLR